MGRTRIARGPVQASSSEPGYSNGPVRFTPNRSRDAQADRARQMQVRPDTSLTDPVTKAVDTREGILGAALAEGPSAGSGQGPGQGFETTVNAATKRAGDCTELTGRGAEFRVVTALLSKVNAGPEALVIEGEQGIGKTTFLLDVLRWAREMESHVLVARPSNAEMVLPFAGLGDLLDQVSD